MNKSGQIYSVFFIFIFLFINSPLSAQQMRNNAVQIIESTNTHITVQLKIDSIQTKEKIINQKTYHQISISGFHFTTEPGKPQLPATGMLIAVPTSGSATIEIVEARDEIHAGIELLPLTEAVLGDTGMSYLALETLAKNDMPEGWFPANPVQLGEPAFIREQRVLPIQIYPVQYHQAQKLLRCYRSLVFRIRFEQPSTPNPASSIQPRFEAMLQGLLPNYEMGKNWRAKRESSLALEKPAFGTAARLAYKIYVNQDGIYRLTGADLETAGISLADIDPRTIRLFNKGIELPIFVAGENDRHFDPADYIDFYGEFNRGDYCYFSPYSDENVYWLTWGEKLGQRLAETDAGLYVKDPAQLISPTAFQFVQHVEQDKVFDRLLLVTDEGQDHWFWETMNAPRSYEFTFQLLHPIITDTAHIRVMLHGSTHPDKNPDHHTVVKLNNEVIDDALWDGQMAYQAAAAIPNARLKDGENTLRIALPGDSPAGEVDQVFFNWVEVTYWREFRARGDFIEIPWKSNDRVVHQFRIVGFSQPEIGIIDNRGRRLVNFDVQESDSGYQVTFQDQPPHSGVRYFIYGPQASKKVSRFEVDTLSNLRSPQNGADYILITHKQFRDAARPLVEHRQSQSLRVALVDVQDIYDEFSDGTFDPRAIQKFLRYAYEHWSPPAPLYVLLLGDATWAYDKPPARNWGKTCYIPSIMKYTYSWGLTSSDNAFVCVSGDDRLPDMFIGRLPVNSDEEAKTVINKIIQYEKQPQIGEWRKRICLACGDDPFFESSADYLYNEYIPKSFEIPRLYTNPRSKYFGSTQELVGLFNNGVALLNFIGHGGGGVFFDADLFLLEDIALLNNARSLPVIFSFTCFIGYFDNPWTPSLGEELLRARDKGCVATFGAAGRAWLYGDYFLNNGLFEALFKNGHRYLGQITTQAKWRMISWTGSYWDHVENYNLLGDPAMAIGLPEQSIALDVSPATTRSGGSVTVRGNLPAAFSGQAKISLVDAADSAIATQVVPVTGSRLEAQLGVPSHATAGNGWVKAYFWNEASDGVGAAAIGIEAPAFSQVGTIPAEPGHQDSIQFQARIELPSGLSPTGIDSAVCQYSYNQYFWYHLSMKQQASGFYQTIQRILVSEGSKIYYKLSAYFRQPGQSASKSMTSPIYSLAVLRRADLRFGAPELVISGKETILIQTRIVNSGETPALDFSVELLDIESDDSAAHVLEKRLIQRLAAQADTALTFTWPLQSQPRLHPGLVIDAENQVKEFYENNNEFRTELQLITHYQGSGGSVASLDSSFCIDVAPGSVTANCSFDIFAIAGNDLNRQYPLPPGFQIASRSDALPQIYGLRLHSDQTRFLKSYAVSFKYPKTPADSLPRIFAWDEEYRNWSHRYAAWDSAHCQLLATAFPDDRLFGLFWVNDATPPKLTVRIENQHFAAQDYVSANPIISAAIEDESGIDLKAQPLQVHLDGELVSLTEQSLWISPQSNKMLLLRYCPALSPGEHTIKIKAADLAGNWSEQALPVTVSGEFVLQAIANHPNPFADVTVIAYTLTSEAQQVTLNIYTASGRLIRRFEFANEVGYIEHEWDGCDESGDEVANGVYYLKFIAKQGPQKIERVEKMAKLK